MSGTAPKSRDEQRAEEVCAATMRAIGADPSLHFRGRRLHRAGRAVPMQAAHLQPIGEIDEFRLFRGAADGMVLRLVHTDAELHSRLAPPEPIERMVFELLEQFRVESLGSDTMPGMRANLLRRFHAWTHAFDASGLTENSVGLLLFTVAQICRLRVTHDQILPEVEDRMESTRASLAPLLGHALAGLKRERVDQAAYAIHALAIARHVATMVRDVESAGQDGEPADGARALRERALGAFGLLVDFDASDNDGIAPLPPGGESTREPANERYRVFTTRYDRVVDAADLVRPAQLAELREQLDRRIAAQGLNLSALARELRERLATPVRDDWVGGLEEGYVDGRRLSLLVSSPAERRIFRLERDRPVASGLVTFLLDCSGSMRTHAESVAMIVDVFARALDLAGARCEVLGFTTAAWDGGRARRDWEAAGRPPAPGRLNELRHIVFKDSATPWRKARRAIAALLRGDLLREGVDGEAVRWACTRALATPAARRSLVVVSDGSPMDSATHRLNGAGYLDRHLREVVAECERTREPEIAAIGVGLDLSPYYRRSLALDLTRSFGAETFAELTELVAPRAGARR